MQADSEICWDSQVWPKYEVHVKRIDARSIPTVLDLGFPEALSEIYNRSLPKKILIHKVIIVVDLLSKLSYRK